MTYFMKVARVIGRTCLYVRNTFLEALELDWIVKEDTDESFVGRGRCPKENKKEVFELTYSTAS